MKFSKYIRLIIFGMLYVFTFLVILLNSISIYDFYKREMKNEIKNYINFQKYILKEKVDLIAEEFEFILNNINSPKKDKIENFKKIIENYNTHHKDKYIFIDSEKGGILVHPDKKIIGLDFLKLNNEKKKKLKEMLIKKSHSKNHFIFYEWFNPKTGKEEFKISYIKHIKNSPYFIGSGIYSEKIEQIKENIKKEYFSIFINYLLRLIAVVLFLSFVLYILLRKFNEKIINDLEKLEYFIKNEKIEVKEFYFEEFINLARKIIEVLKDKLKLLKRLEYKTYYDSLTDLPNKLKLKEDLTKLNYKGAMILDIKNFSLVNEYYSIEMGDVLLKTFSKILRSLLPKECKIYRFSADEFIVLNMTGISCNEIIGKVRNYFRKNSVEIKYRNKKIPINIEIIAAVLRKKYIEKNDVIKKLNLALSHVKKTDGAIVEYSEILDIESKITKKFESIYMMKNAFIVVCP
jgi:diguanylate cyclase (GGDEF)-like protein